MKLHQFLGLALFSMALTVGFFIAALAVYQRWGGQ